MKPELQGIEIQGAFIRDYDLPIQNAAGRQLLEQSLGQLREIPIQRLLITALQQYFVAVPEDQRSKPVPLWFEDPVAVGRQFIHSFGEHRQQRWVYGKVHACYDVILLWRLRA